MPMSNQSPKQHANVRDQLIAKALGKPSPLSEADWANNTSTFQHFLEQARESASKVRVYTSKVKHHGTRAYGNLKMSQVATPVGPLSLGTSNDGLRTAYFDTWWDEHLETTNASNDAAEALMREAKVQVQEYFAGTRKEFTIPLASEGTSFQKKAWAALEKIPYGKTICYEEQATSMGEPSKARAVGAANGKNPICLFVPCHRVIAKDGGLCGYAFGLQAKQYLLDLEAGRLNVSTNMENIG